MTRGRRVSEIPPPLELECLKALWRLGNGSVRDVRDVLTENRNLAYTTVMTVLDRLVRRGAVDRRREGRAFVYAPLLDREHARSIAVKELIEIHFGGSVEALRSYLAPQQTPVPPMTPQRAADTDYSLEPSPLDPTLL